MSKYSKELLFIDMFDGMNQQWQDEHILEYQNNMEIIHKAQFKAELLDNMLAEITSAQFTHSPMGNVYTDRRRVYEIVEDTQAKYEEIK